MNKRRTILKKLVEAKREDFRRLNMTEEQIEKCIFYYEHNGYLKIRKPEEYNKWSNYSASRTEDSITLQKKLIDLQEQPTLEDAAEIIFNEGIAVNGLVLSSMFTEIKDTSSPEFWDDDDIYKLMQEYAMAMPYTDVVSNLGNAYGKLGIPVDKIPEIGLQDTYFLKGYLDAFPANEENILKEGNPEYREYKELYDLVERAQSKIDLRHEKEEQDTLKRRTKTISEAETIVNQQQDQQQE